MVFKVLFFLRVYKHCTIFISTDMDIHKKLNIHFFSIIGKATCFYRVATLGLISPHNVSYLNHNIFRYLLPQS